MRRTDAGSAVARQGGATTYRMDMEVESGMHKKQFREYRCEAYESRNTVCESPRMSKTTDTIWSREPQETLCMHTTTNSLSSAVVRVVCARPALPLAWALAWPLLKTFVTVAPVSFAVACRRNYLIVGGGYIAVEFAGILNGLGAKVTLACCGYRQPACVGCTHGGGGFTRDHPGPGHRHSHGCHQSRFGCHRGLAPFCGGRICNPA